VHFDALRLVVILFLTIPEVYLLPEKIIIIFLIEISVIIVKFILYSLWFYFLIN